MACDVAMPSLRLTPFPPPRWAIMPESDDVVIGKVAEDGDLGAKSLYRSRAMSYFYKTELEIWAVLGRTAVYFIFSILLKYSTLQAVFSCFHGQNQGRTQWRNCRLTPETPDNQLRSAVDSFSNPEVLAVIAKL